MHLFNGINSPQGAELSILTFVRTRVRGHPVGPGQAVVEGKNYIYGLDRRPKSSRRS